MVGYWVEWTAGPPVVQTVAMMVVLRVVEKAAVMAGLSVSPRVDYWAAPMDGYWVRLMADSMAGLRAAETAIAMAAR